MALLDSVTAETEGRQAGWAMTQHPALPHLAGLYHAEPSQTTSNSVSMYKAGETDHFQGDGDVR